jgi:peptidyl-prolyl cis-trans isomerase SurA
MKILSAFAFALLATVAVPRAGAQPATQPLDRIVAVVDEDVVLQSELDSQVNAVTTQYASNPSQLPPRAPRPRASRSPMPTSTRR